ncbi:hypothetical protein NDU88_006538, partial [Pleurodeles waltl]
SPSNSNYNQLSYYKEKRSQMLQGYLSQQCTSPFSCFAVLIASLCKSKICTELKTVA